MRNLNREIVRYICSERISEDLAGNTAAGDDSKKCWNIWYGRIDGAYSTTSELRNPQGNEGVRKSEIFVALKSSAYLKI